jgi:hypothetical protein
MNASILHRDPSQIHSAHSYSSDHSTRYGGGPQGDSSQGPLVVAGATHGEHRTYLDRDARGGIRGVKHCRSLPLGAERHKSAIRL